jgi:2-oxoisovalerate dehydrogenase E1 component
LVYTAIFMVPNSDRQALGGSGTAAAVASRANPLMSAKEFEQAFLIRAFEQKLLALFSEGKLFGTVHTCIGQEFTGVAVCRALRDGDLIFTNHRGHGHFLARTGNVNGLMAEIMGRETGVCGGRGGSQHICSQGVFSNGVQGGIMPVSAGLALAKKIAHSGNIVVVFIGDGTLGEGVVYESFNIASKWDLPLLIVLENNSYAQSTAQRQTLAGDICQRAEAFGIHSLAADTWDPERLCEQAADAVEYVRTQSRPCFLRVDTYRLMAHSKGDDDRDPAEVQRYWDIDPLVLFEQKFPQQAGGYKQRAQERVAAAVEAAEAAPFAAAIVYDPPARHSVSWAPAQIGASDRMAGRIYEALHQAMATDDRLFLLGEDIEAPYGGAFKVTKDLSALFPGRVRNTPISEAALVGIGSGMALAGERPICEIMFGDFLALAGDQIINHAAKFEYMYKGQVSVPLVIRTPVGGKRGYGATHSQSLEKHFLGVPGTQVFALHHRYDPAIFYERLLRTIDRPTIVLENKVLYGKTVSLESPQGFLWEHSEELFPCTRLRPGVPPEVTIVVYGGMLEEAEEAVDQLFEQHDVVAEIICPLQLYPLNLEPIFASVQATRRLLIVEEGQGFCGFGAELLAGLEEHDPALLLQVRRLFAPPHPIPSCKPLELELLPGRESIAAAALEVLQ